MRIVSTGGMPAAGMMPRDFSVSVTGTPSRRTNSSLRAWPRPMWTPPSTWPSASVRFMTRPTSWAAMTRAIAPASSRMTTWVAQP